ncbi:hypothetical protein BKA56DRAFT_145149 [Ilyonectria sp. MPI-CAGE-AT-0026]|nr:hypothetical protein BKA56DRAFT_145149 [Ilyonectria sp. MPI-CAGE-AT-0026]
MVHGAWYCPALDLQALASLALVPMDLSYSLLWDHLLLRAAAFFWMSYVLVPVSPSPRTTPLAILAACAPAALLLLLLGIALLGVSTAEHIMTFRFVVTLALRTRPLALAIFQSHFPLPGLVRCHNVDIGALVDEIGTAYHVRLAPRSAYASATVPCPPPRPLRWLVAKKKITTNWGIVRPVVRGLPVVGSS